jgi:large subunit ribosomal protein L7/L12
MELLRALMGIRFKLLAFACVAAAFYAGAEEPSAPGFVDLILTSYESKIQAVKAVHDIAGLGIKDSKDLVESAPKAILAGVPKEEAQQAQKHAEALKCKTEIRPAQESAAAGLPVRKFDVVIVKVDASKKDSAIKAIQQLLPSTEQNSDRAQALAESGGTLQAGLTAGRAELKIAALNNAGVHAEPVSSGGIETGGYRVVLNKIDPANKIRTVSVIRANTGLSLADAKAVVDSAPKAVKIKVSKEEADKLKAEFENLHAVVEIRAEK